MRSECIDELGAAPAIPKTAPPTGISLHALSGGRFEVTCGRCLGRDGTSAASPEEAWSALSASGWVHYRPVPEVPGYAVCPPCVAKNETIEDAVRRAKKGCRRK